MRRVAASLALAGCAALAAAPAAGQTPETSVARAEKVVGELDNRIVLIEKLYARENELSEIEVAKRRFSDAEIQFLLGEYGNASVLLYDLVEDRRFRESGKHGDGLYYLAESLYKLRNFLGARRYFRELLQLGQGRYVGEALKRYLELSGKLNDFSGMEEYFRMAQRAAGGKDSPELNFVYAKWAFRRTDHPKQERLERSEKLFLQLLGGPYGAKAGYFLGVIAVERGQLDTAAMRFEDVVKRESGPRGDLALRELANLSLGRVYYEQGKFDQAIDRYQEIGQDSSSFNESLYEIAWTFVKKGAHEKALRATELLLLVAQDTTMAPDATILLGHLYLKLGKYGEAKETYTQVINTYAPVRDEIDALLTTHADPVAYFNQLLSANQQTLDVEQLLPPVAIKWATTEKEVGNAVRVLRDLDDSKSGIGESRTIANRLLENLGRGTGLEASPTLAEGMAKAEAAEAEALATDRLLLQAELELVGSRIPAELSAQLAATRKEMQVVEAKFNAIPKTPEAVDARKERMKDRLADLESTMYKLSTHVESVDAQIRAVQKWLADTRDSRAGDPEGEWAFQEELRQELERAQILRDQYETIRREIADERAAVGGGGGGKVEAELRNRYGELLAQERALVVQARGGGSPLFARIDRVRAQLDSIRARVVGSKDKIRGLADKKANEIRSAVLAESRLLDEYEGETKGASSSARDLVGQIAYESFRRVRKSFYGLVLKADVGLIDVAWTRKRDKSAAIQKLSQEKDRDLKELDEEFRDVLREEP